MSYDKTVLYKNFCKSNKETWESSTYQLPRNQMSPQKTLIAEEQHTSFVSIY